MASLLVAALLQATVAFTTVARSTDSGIMQPRSVVVRTVAEWDALWKEHGAGERPPIDFASVTVLGVFLGTRSSAGFSVEIVSVTPTGHTLLVEYRERRPPSGALTAQLLTAPFHLVQIPKASGPIEFRKLE